MKRMTTICLVFVVAVTASCGFFGNSTNKAIKISTSTVNDILRNIKEPKSQQSDHSKALDAISIDLNKLLIELQHNNEQNRAATEYIKHCSETIKIASVYLKYNLLMQEEERKEIYKRSFKQQIDALEQRNAAAEKLVPLIKKLLADREILLSSYSEADLVNQIPAKEALEVFDRQEFLMF